MIGESQKLDIADMSVVLGYFVIIIIVGIVASCVSKRDTVQEYFLAGRKMNFFLVGASLFVSNVGSEHFVGLAGSGAAGGIGVGAWVLNALVLLQLLGWVFVPVYIASGICTMPQYLGRRFGGQRLRVYLATLTLLLYILTKISVNLYSGALFIEQALGWPLFTSVTLLVGLTSILTVTGGLTVVMYTDSLQAILMITGATFLAAKGFSQVGGYYGMKDKYVLSAPNITLAQIKYNVTINISDPCFPRASPESFRMLKSNSDPDVPWLGFIIGQTPSSLWYWCTDQVLVQRTLAAKSLSHAQGGTIMAAFLKILPIFIMVMPGMIARVLFTDDLICLPGDHCLKVCGNSVGCSNFAFPRLVLGILPSGARGLMVAVMIAALMSGLDSIFNSASTIFTLDLWKRMRKNASSAELMIVGRLFIVALSIISILWIPIIQRFQGGQLFFYIQEVTNYISPPIAAIFVIGVLWPGCTEKGAFYGGLIGSVLGIVRLVFIFVYSAPKCGEEDQRPYFLSNINYMYYSGLMFFITLAVAFIVSLFTEKPREENISRLTYWSRNDLPPLKKEMYSMGSIKDTDNSSLRCDEKHYEIGETSVESCRWKKCALMFGRFICGIKKESPNNVIQPEPQYYSLEQTKPEKIILTVFLVCILSCGLSLYILWSI